MLCLLKYQSFPYCILQGPLRFRDSEELRRETHLEIPVQDLVGLCLQVTGIIRDSSRRQRRKQENRGKKAVFQANLK